MRTPLIRAIQDNLVSNVTEGEHHGSCNHTLVHVELRAQTTVTENNIRVPNFKRANFVEIQQKLRDTTVR